MMFKGICYDRDNLYRVIVSKPKGMPTQYAIEYCNAGIWELECIRYTFNEAKDYVDAWFGG